MPHGLQFLLLLTLLIAVAKAAGALALRARQPALLGELLVGLLLGPTLLNLPEWSLFGAHGTHEALRTIHDLAEMGVVLVMFLAGIETDRHAFQRVGRTAFFAAIGGIVVPVGLGMFTVWSWLELLDPTLSGTMHIALFVGALLAATSVSISAQTLLELGQLRSREGTTILAAAVIDDVVGLLLVSVILALTPAPAARGEADPFAGFSELVGHTLGVTETPAAMMGLLLVGMGLFAWLGWTFGERYVGRLLTWSGRQRVSQPVLALTLVLAFGYGWAAQWIGGVAAITGSYMAGLIVGGTSQREVVEHRIAPLTYGLFVPIFFINIGLHADARPLFAPLVALSQGLEPAWGPFLFTIAVCAVAIVAKAGGCWVGARLGGFTNLESLRVGVGMISRGEVGLIVASLGLSNGILNQAGYSVMVIMVLITTLVTPPLLTLVFPRVAHPDEPEPEGIADEFDVEAVIGETPQ